MTKPALFAAIAADDLAALERALQHDLHGACQTDADNGRSALHEAAALGRTQVLVILLRYLRGYPGLDRSGATPLLLALRGGHLDAARSILTHQAACWGVQGGCLEALVATGVDSVDMAREMFHRGLPLRHRGRDDGDPKQVGRDGLPPLHLLALAEGDNAALAQALLAHGADLLLRHPVWGHAIDFARTLGRTELADCLTANRDLARFRWQADARRLGVDCVAIWVDKGMGLRWNPNNPVKPLDVGGDYDGPWPMTPAQALAELKRCGLFALLAQPHQALVQKLVDGQDFGLDQALALFAPSQVRWRR